MNSIESVVRYKTKDGAGVVCLRLNDVGRKAPIRLIPMDASGIKVVRLPVSEERYIEPIDYPVRRARARFRQAVRKFNGGFRNASAIIKEILR